MLNQTLHLVLVPGLDDGKYGLLGSLFRLWGRTSVKLHLYPVGWRDGGPFEVKLAGLLSLIDELMLTGQPVALIGISAGGSLAINAYLCRPNLVGVVNVCGRLLIGPSVSPSLDQSARKSTAFKRSVQVCDRDHANLPPKLRARVLVLQPWRDPVVPLATMLLDGAQTRRIMGLAHVDSIVLALLLQRRAILAFLRSQS